MKKLFLILLFLVSLPVNILAAQDTTITADLNSDGTKDKIKLSFSDTNWTYNLSINNLSVSKTLNDMYEVHVEIIDLDRYDGIKEIVVTGYGPNDYAESYFYSYDGGNITEIGYIPLHIGYKVEGKNTVSARNWMGFWSMEQEYKYNPKTKTLTKQVQEFYSVNEKGEITEQLNLLEERSDNSQVSAKVAPGTKFTIIKADLIPKCKYGDGSDDDYSCDWYYFFTRNGESGWCRLKDFQQKVKGLNWAG